MAIDGIRRRDGGIDLIPRRPIEAALETIIWVRPGTRRSAAHSLEGVAASTSPTAAEMGGPTGPAKTPEVTAEPAPVGQSPSEPAPVARGS